MKNKRLKYLLPIREHLKDGIEGHRKRLSELWKQGKTDTWLYKRLKEQYELMQTKLDNVYEEIFETVVPIENRPANYNKTY